MTLHQPSAILFMDRWNIKHGEWRVEGMKNVKKAAEVTAQFFGMVVGNNFTTPPWLISELYPRLELSC